MNKFISLIEKIDKERENESICRNNATNVCANPKVNMCVYDTRTFVCGIHKVPKSVTHTNSIFINTKYCVLDGNFAETILNNNIVDI